MFHFRLRTLLIVLAVGPPVLAGGHFCAAMLVANNRAAGARILQMQTPKGHHSFLSLPVAIWSKPVEPGRPNACGNRALAEMLEQQACSPQIIVED